MDAIVDIAGTQEKVSEGQKLLVPRLKEEPGSEVSLETVLMLLDKDGKVTTGSPHVSGATVKVKVLDHSRGKKLRVFKMKRRKRYRRTIGSRPDYTEIEVLKIAT